MDNKLHIKAICGRNIKVDADWYGYGDEIDCYLTPAQFKDYIEGFLEYDIIMDKDSSPKSIDIEVEYKIVEEKTEEVVKDEQVSKPRTGERKPVSKGTKKVG